MNCLASAGPSEQATRFDEVKPFHTVEKVKEAILTNSLRRLFRRPFSQGFTDGSICTTPLPISENQIDMHRSMLVHDQQTLLQEGVDFSLTRTLNKVAQTATSVAGVTAEDMFQKIWDTQNSNAGAQTTGAHCDDNGSTINGFPVGECPRDEGIEATVPSNISDYTPTALVNRIDLASAGWRNCGEHRIIYGKRGVPSFRKNLVIFEAVLPNPKPGCRSGCRDVIEFWVNLSNDSNPGSRANKLEDFFYNGLPGFSPVVSVNHYNSSTNASFYGNSQSGQIRTNQFLQFPWRLKEFKTMTTCAGGNCDIDIVPISVKANPFGPLWNKDTGTALANNFQNSVVSQVTDALLGHPDIGSMSYGVSNQFNAASSNSQNGGGEDNYTMEMNDATDASFRNALSAAGSTLTQPLTNQQIANRALTQSCAGCHQPGVFGLTAANSIGLGQSWPNALNFVHVDVSMNANLNGMPEFNAANFAGNNEGSNLSPALLNDFLPARETNLVTEYNKEICNCEPNLVLSPRLDLPLIRANNRVISEAVIDLTPPELIERARRSIQREQEILKKEKPSKKVWDESIRKQREILADLDKNMAHVTNLRSLRARDNDSRRIVETERLPRGTFKGMDKKEMAEFKAKLAAENEMQHPTRQTTTGSFRTH